MSLSTETGKAFHCLGNSTAAYLVKTTRYFNDHVVSFLSVIYMKCLSVFSVKRERAPCQPWPLASVATGFRPLWRMCDPLLPPMSLGNTQRRLTLQPLADITTGFLAYFILIPLSSSPSLSFFLFLPQPVFSTCLQEKHLSETIRSEAQVGVLVCCISPPPRTVMLLLSNVSPGVSVVPPYVMWLLSNVSLSVVPL